MLNACIRCTSLFVGFFSLVQGLIWAGFSIWVISVYDCSSTFPAHTPPANYYDKHDIGYLFYVTYFRGPCANQGMSYVSPTAKHSFNLMLSYSILSSIWVPTSVILLAGTCLGARGAKAMWIYIPWLIIAVACSILDVYATVVYSIDISKSTTTSDFIQMLNFPDDGVKKALGFGTTVGLDGKTFLPSIYMTLISSRGIILWIINLFFIIFGLQGVCAFAKSPPPKTPRPYHEYEEEIKRQKEFEHQKEFKKPTSVNNVNSIHPLPNTMYLENDEFAGRENQGFMPEEPLRLNPVEVEVKQERSNQIRYAEVEDIELETTPQEIRLRSPETVRFADDEPDDDTSRVEHFNNKLEKLKKLGVIVPVWDGPSHEEDPGSSDEGNQPIEAEEIRGVFGAAGSISVVSVGVNALEEEEEDEGPSVIPLPPSYPPPAEFEDEQPRRVYDVNGNPTDEELPKVSRIQQIIEAWQNSPKTDANGFNTRPFSYIQPDQPQVDVVKKVNNTIRGVEKPPIPVPDYDVSGVSKKPSFRSPTPHNTN